MYIYIYINNHNNNRHNIGEAGSLSRAGDPKSAEDSRHLQDMFSISYIYIYIYIYVHIYVYIYIY